MSRIAESRLVFLLALLMVFGLLWFEAVTPPRDDFLIENPAVNGTSELRDLALPLNVSLEYLAANPTQHQTTFLLVLAPRLPFSSLESSSIDSFVKGGGTLFVADNFGVGNQLLRSLNFPVQFGNASIHDNLFYKSAPVFPVVYDLWPEAVNASVKELVLNNAAALTILDNNSVTVLARTSPFSYEDSNSNSQRDPGERRGPFPVLASGREGRGTIYVFSSPGSFSNAMLQDADNSRLLQFLSGQGNRTMLIDQQHLAISGATGMKLALQAFVRSVALGSLDQSLKLELVFVIWVAFAFWLAIPSLRVRRIARETLAPKQTLEEILSSHPSWSRERLEYVQREKWKESGIT